MKKTFIAIIISALVLFGLTFFAQNKSDSSLRIGTNAEYPPFCFEKNGEIVGFDIDLTNLIAEKMGKKAKIVNTAFDVLIPAIQSGKMDILGAGIDKTPERAKTVLFSDVYLRDSFVLLSRKDNPISVNEIDNKIITVNQGYTNEDVLKSLSSNVETLSLPSPNDSLLALDQHKADGYILDRATYVHLPKDRQEQYHVENIKGVVTEFALPCATDEMVKSVNEILNQFSKDGTLDKLKEKWDFQ